MQSSSSRTASARPATSERLTNLVGGLVVVARVDGRAHLAAQARAAPAARLVAEGCLWRGVAAQVLDAVLNGALVGVL